MRTGGEQSRGGHVGDGGIQGWSAGETWPWVVYVQEHYARTKVFRAGQWRDTGAAGMSLDDRFLFAEIRMKHPNGADVLLASYDRNANERVRKIVHKVAQERAEVYAKRSDRVWATLDAMAQILHYGQPQLPRKEVVAEVARQAKAIVNQVAPRGLYNHSEGYEHCSCQYAQKGGPVMTSWGV